MTEKRKVRVGQVVGNKMDKTAVVLVETRRRDPLYKKVVTHRAMFKAHDAANACQIGDKVRIVETRPLSKTKRWRVAEILSHEEGVGSQPSQDSGIQEE